MRPRKLDPDSEELLVLMYEKVKRDMEKRSNQFQVAAKLSACFHYPDASYSDTSAALDGAKRRWEQLEGVARYFGLPDYVFTHGHYGRLVGYLGSATPAAIVQMVKRKKTNEKN